ncbi:ABC transporter ATP-binding protein [Companilactobacillus sp.]|jgi:ATP-binding cassette subfamily B protein|uniref:ABC transporter ATP-binding protein n=1 Tax=Companilactobacillus sp. TaxID=2767905 RepID=UPI0025B8A1DF|nr:ABC transporter ATP-binding protein [Companilactobacillus sp.]MCH4009407.1 ABC transporter ATP-binding protein/permease [Companilactobacillus sp.]MCH4050414.1 ABC transporter ATP-binding protein/permease [Companilactobacillus sp.]MCH4077349.1 ABC transporter ATP-binding protein/permease [Companilactobacillus sp.]MCH4125925.1 ABC transporter ATP-binding protein/permease [Companilactobacillus sp.]MCI1311634.1 ABC transporter ATP-binding protein/permease [Companilactobacillus sp.]
MLKLLKRLNKREYGMILVSVIFIALQVWLELKIPDYMSVLTQQLETKGTTVSQILSPGMTMLLLSILSVVASVIVGYFVAKIAAGFTARLRKDTFNQVMDFSQEDLKKFSIPSLLTRSTNDITQVQTFVAMGLQAIIKAPITAIWAITKIANKGWQWTTATGIAVLLLVLMLTFILLMVQPKFKVVQGLTDRLNSITRENLNGIKVVHAYNAEDYQNEKFDEANNNLTKTNLFAYRVLSLMNPGMTFISSALTLSVYAIGAVVIEAAAQTQKLVLFGNMIVFSSYAMQVIMGFLLLSIIFVLLPRVSVSANRLNEVLDVKPSIQYPEQSGSEDNTEESGKIEFDNVGFKYQGAESSALKDMSFTANKGQTIAFIGSTGSGKSTALQLISRLYDATSGSIKIDGRDIRKYTEKDLNDKIGYVPQSAVLFSGTIRSNIDFGTKKNRKALTDEEIYQALDIAQSKDFVMDKDKQLDAPVAQNGDNFSGGQKQRLGIARAVARRPEILLFDDSFSALDYETDAKLRQSLKEKAGNITKIIVAQRISTVMDADQIIVLDNGEVVGQGTHQELLKDNHVYQEIAYSQLSKEELANGK